MLQYNNLLELHSWLERSRRAGRAWSRSRAGDWLQLNV
jgi:hypothetical protein